VARFFSLRGSATHSAAFASLVGFALGVMLGAGVENVFEGEEEFGNVGCGPFCDPANKRFNHVRSAFILEINAAAHTEKGDAFFPRPFHDEPQR
jgi:hypothetical protein